MPRTLCGLLVPKAGGTRAARSAAAARRFPKTDSVGRRSGGRTEPLRLKGPEPSSASPRGAEAERERAGSGLGQPSAEGAAGPREAGGAPCSLTGARGGGEVPAQRRRPPAVGMGARKCRGQDCSDWGPPPRNAHRGHADFSPQNYPPLSTGWRGERRRRVQALSTAARAKESPKGGGDRSPQATRCPSAVLHLGASCSSAPLPARESLHLCRGPTLGRERGGAAPLGFVLTKQQREGQFIPKTKGPRSAGGQPLLEEPEPGAPARPPLVLLDLPRDKQTAPSPLPLLQP